jgi:hypothetical protein
MSCCNTIELRDFDQAIDQFDVTSRYISPVRDIGSCYRTRNGRQTAIKPLGVRCNTISSKPSLHCQVQRSIISCARLPHGNRPMDEFPNRSSESNQLPISP